MDVKFEYISRCSTYGIRVTQDDTYSSFATFLAGEDEVRADYVAWLEQNGVNLSGLTLYPLTETRTLYIPIPANLAVLFRIRWT